ncbi:TPA: DSD1 family PLP-dependent enzyme [Candidatus Poribacteria bacterium]|nr:DSD1 family PLP-dependent enzyme [Candidatus Poribacteria bacterium]
MKSNGNVFIGVDINEIDTPALLLDLDILEANIAKMADFFKGVKAELRPHVKTHKTPIISHKQIEAGAIGMTCAKLSEAEVMVYSGIRDILIANQIVGRQKIARLVNLAKHADMMVAVDNPQNVDDLSAAAMTKGVILRILIEVDTGLNRCGVETGEAVLNLAQQISQADGLSFAGLMGYEGHCVMIQNRAERERETLKSVQILVDMKHLLEENGFPVEIMSGGGTGTYDITGSHTEMTEIQAGSYATMDTQYRSIEGIGDTFDCALSILTTVISCPQPDRIVTDAGMKVMTQEFEPPQPKNIIGLELVSLSEEHGKFKADASVNLKVGDKFGILPTHGCTTINLHDKFYCVRNGKLECVWEISARGKSQ